ncbi:hypothetical protein SHXM_09527 [Streptomyces hygroscopicus]|nr:hypothetical protein SHXM_09527 [Streptomyces hygroscopicus]
MLKAWPGMPPVGRAVVRVPRRWRRKSRKRPGVLVQLAHRVEVNEDSTVEVAPFTPR